MCAGVKIGGGYQGHGCFSDGKPVAEAGGVDVMIRSAGEAICEFFYCGVVVLDNCRIASVEVYIPGDDREGTSPGGAKAVVVGTFPVEADAKGGGYAREVTIFCLYITNVVEPFFVAVLCVEIIETHFSCHMRICCPAAFFAGRTVGGDA